MVLSDDDPQKWDYRIHTRAKHGILSRYIKAWLAILSYDARRSGRPAHLTIVDGFAGRGRYNEGEEGSPVIFRRVAEQVISQGIADEVELYFIEAGAENHKSLVSVLDEVGSFPGVTMHPPIRGDFATEAPVIIDSIARRPRPSFWFVDPFGFKIPLSVIRSILRLNRSEVFITFMARDTNRFMEVLQHRGAIAELLDLSSTALEAAILEVVNSDDRISTLRELYKRRLEDGAGAKHVLPFRVATDGAKDTVYYLMHASKNILALQEMKKAMNRAGAGLFAFLGKADYDARMRPLLFDLDTLDLPENLLHVFRGREITFEDLCLEADPDPRFYKFLEPDYRAALNRLAAEGRVVKIQVQTKRGLKGKERLKFFATPPARSDVVPTVPAAVQGRLFG